MAFLHVTLLTYWRHLFRSWEVRYWVNGIVPPYAPSKLSFSQDSREEIDAVQQYVLMLSTHDAEHPELLFLGYALAADLSTNDIALTKAVRSLINWESS